VLSNLRRRTVSQSDSLHRLVRWALYIFVLSIPFEYPRRTIPIETTTLTGCLFLLATLLQPRRCFRLMPTPVLWFMLFLWALLASFVVNGAGNRDEVVRLLLNLLQLVLLLWSLYNVLRDEDVARSVLVAFVLACVARSVLQFAGIADIIPDDPDLPHRPTTLGQNPNHAARVLGGGLLTLIWLTYGARRRLFRRRTLAWALGALLAVAIVQTGSRGGLVALVAGLLFFALDGRTLRERIRNSLLAVLVPGLVVLAASRTDITRSRFERVAETGSIEGRGRIYPTAWQMFLEKPLTGWGPINNKYELARRLPEQHHTRRDTHNLILEVLSASGLLGALTFLTGTWLAMLAAWRARRGPQGILPLVLMGAMLAGNMSGNYIAAKLPWLVMAYALAGASQQIAARVRRVAIYRPYHGVGMAAHAATASTTAAELR
jgi:O-antigen ligase